ncbi:MAG: hypothetical protein ABEI80_02150 [Haloplanus sp.]
MWTPSRRTVGASTVLGGVLAVVAAIPTDWYGPRPTDSYVFDPPPFSALWIERTVVPAASVLAAVLLLAGLISVLRRDRDGLDGWQRWSAVGAVLGVGVGTLSTVLFASAGGAAGGDLSAALNVLLGALLGLLAVVLAVPGLIAWGIGYVRAGRSTLGAAIAGGPGLSVLLVVTSAALGVEFGPLGGLPVVLPLAAMAVLIGSDLYHRPT